MSPKDSLAQLQPPPEVVALGQPERADLLTRHFGPVESPLSRILSDPRLVFAPKATAAQYVRQAYAFYSDALAYFQDGQWRIIRWDEIIELRGPTMATADAELSLLDGSQVALRAGFWTNSNVLMEVERRAHGPLLERATKAIAAGEAVAFGPLVLTEKRLLRRQRSAAGRFTRWLIEDAVSDDTSLTWDEIGSLVVDAPVTWRLLLTGVQPLDPRLRIGKRGEQKWSPMWGTMGQEMAWWFEDRLLTIPNRSVLLALLLARRPAHARTEIFRQIDRYVAWDPDREGSPVLADC